MFFFVIQGYSCAELKEQGLEESGIYYLLIRGTNFWFLKVYCEMEEANGGWTVSLFVHSLEERVPLRCLVNL